MKKGNLLISARFGSSILTFVGVLLASALFSKVALAEASFEIMCRAKAKEIAAEKYKDCMTENRQAQIEQIRKDYKTKLAKLKNHYDEKLKKVGQGVAVTGKANANSNATVATSSSNQTAKSYVSDTPATPKAAPAVKRSTRPSGARMPGKNQTYSTSSPTQVIDLSQPVEAQLNTEEEVYSESRLGKQDVNEMTSPEIVEQAPQ